MSTLAASNLDEPPPNKINKPLFSSPSPFSSLPNDIVLNIISRIPKSFYPILSCVSKSFQILVRSPEIQQFRSLLDKDSLYICFVDANAKTQHWFTLRKMEKNPTKNLFVSIDFPFVPNLDNYYSSIISVGPEIFIIVGSSQSRLSFLIYDSRSGKYRRGPSMQADLLYTSVGLVGGKVYVIGTCRTHDYIKAESFDLKTQTWKPAPVPDDKTSYKWICQASVALDRKIYALDSRQITCYDTRDGSCDSFGFAHGLWCSSGVCVINNVLYVYYVRLGLMWYDSKLKKWRMVDGLEDLRKIIPAAMAEYYGKLAYIWTKSGCVVDLEEQQEIWCSMIALDRNEVGIHGTAEPSQLLGLVPHRYSLKKCLSLSA